MCICIWYLHMYHRALGGAVCLLSLCVHDREHAYVHALKLLFASIIYYFFILLQYFVYGAV